MRVENRMNGKVTTNAKNRAGQWQLARRRRPAHESHLAHARRLRTVRPIGGARHPSLSHPCRASRNAKGLGLLTPDRGRKPSRLFGWWGAENQPLRRLAHALRSAPGRYRRATRRLVGWPGLATAPWPPALGPVHRDRLFGRLGVGVGIAGAVAAVLAGAFFAAFEPPPALAAEPPAASSSLAEAVEAAEAATFAAFAGAALAGRLGVVGRIWRTWRCACWAW